jgi:hypothetical protein
LLDIAGRAGCQRDDHGPDGLLAAGTQPGAGLGRRGAEGRVPHPVGLEYTIVAVTCLFSWRRGLSGGDLVFVCEPAEDLFAADPVVGEVDLRWPGVRLSRRKLAEGTVGPGRVVMPQVFGQHLSQVVLIDDQGPVKDFPSQGADDPFADRVAPHRQLHLIGMIGTGVPV